METAHKLRPGKQLYLDLKDRVGNQQKKKSCEWSTLFGQHQSFCFQPKPSGHLLCILISHSVSKSMSTYFHAGTQWGNWYEKQHLLQYLLPMYNLPSAIPQYYKRERKITITEMEKKGSLTQTKTPWYKNAYIYTHLKLTVIFLQEKKKEISNY